MRRPRPRFDGYSSLWLRRLKKIRTPKAIATIAAKIRIVVASMEPVLLSICLSADHMFSIIGINSRTNCVITGLSVTTNREGSTQKKIGNTSFTGSFEACSSAR